MSAHDHHHILARLRAIRHRIVHIGESVQALRRRLIEATTRRELERIAEHMASAIDNLNTAVTDLTTEVDADIAFFGVPHPTDAQIQSAADAVVAQTARLTAARTAASGAPTPAPATPTPPPA